MSDKDYEDKGAVILTSAVFAAQPGYPSNRARLDRVSAAHDLTDDDIKNCNDILQKGDGPLHVEALLGALGATLREVQRNRAALAADRERIEAVVYEVAMAEISDLHLSNRRDWCRSIADLAAGRLATPVNLLGDARAQVEHLTNLHRVAEVAMHSAYDASKEYQRIAEREGNLASDLETERDSYRAMLADLLATMGPLWAKARLLLKHGPLECTSVPVDAASPVHADPANARQAFQGFLSQLGCMPELRDDDLEYLWNHVGGETGFVRPLIAEIVRRRTAEAAP
jgi:hypothetical protein